VPADKNDIRLLGHEPQTEEVLHLQLVDFLRPVPVELVEHLDDREACGADPTFHGALLAHRALAIEQTLEELEVRPRRRRGFLGERGVMFGDVAELVGHIKISAVPGLAGAEAHRLPVARFVTGARIRLRVGETLGERRTVAEVFLPLRGQRAQGRAHRLRGEVGRTAFFAQDEEPAVLHDQLQPLHALVGAPTDPAVPVLKRVARRTPHQQCGGLAAHGDDLPQVIPDRPPGPEVVARGQLRVEPLPLRGGGDSHGRGCAAVRSFVVQGRVVRFCQLRPNPVHNNSPRLSSPKRSP
jgi:hypothetical protein